jgi:hypothetical protein
MHNHTAGDNTITRDCLSPNTGTEFAFTVCAATVLFLEISIMNRVLAARRPYTLKGRCLIITVIIFGALSITLARNAICDAKNSDISGNIGIFALVNLMCIDKTLEFYYMRAMLAPPPVVPPPDEIPHGHFP